MGSMGQKEEGGKKNKNRRGIKEGLAMGKTS